MAATYPNNVNSYSGVGSVSSASNVIYVTGTTTLYAQQSGSIIYVDIAANTYTITLPSPVGKQGTTFTFIFQNAAATNTGVVTIDSSAASLLCGNILTTSGAAGACVFAVASANRNLVTVASHTAEGDRAVFISDGVKWQVVGQFGNSANGASFT